MLRPVDVLRISEPIEQMFMDCVSQLIINIARHFSTGKGLTTRDWETQKLSELGALTEESIEIIAANTGQAPEAIRKAIVEGMGLGIEEGTLAAAAAAGVIQGPSVSWQASESVRTVIKNLTDQAVNDANIVNTVMLQSTRQRYLYAVQMAVDEELKLIETLQSAAGISQLDQKLNIAQMVLNSATTSVAVGAEARQTAVRRAVEWLADNGITGFVDAGGHHWSPEAYINMDIRTTVHNAAIQGSRARSADYGVQTFQISSHAAARPLCAPYQGKFYSWDGTSGVLHDLRGNTYRYESIYNTSYGEPAGIFGINCGHFAEPFVDGYSLARYGPTEDEAKNAEEYALTQKQRKLERDIRSEKTKALAYDAAGDKEAFDKTALRIREKNAQYRAFCDENNLTQRLERTQVVGYNRSVSSKATQAQRFHAAIDGTVTSDGITIKSTVHLYGQARTRGVSSGAIVDSLTNPLEIKPVKYDEQGRPSKQYVGERATTAVNPENGNATTCTKTHSRIVKKLKGGQK